MSLKAAASILPITLTDWVEEERLTRLVRQILDKAAKGGATQAEVHLSMAVGLSVSLRLDNVDHISFEKEKGLDIVVYQGQQRGTVSTTDWSESAIDAALAAAHNIASYTEADPYTGLADPAEMATQALDLDLNHPWDLSVEEAVRLARATESAGRQDARIVNSEGANVSSSQSYQIYANSHGFIGKMAKSRHGINCQLIAEQAGSKETDYAYTAARDPKKLHCPEAVGKEAAEKTIARLGARKLPTQKVPVVFDAQIAGSLWSHYIHAISGSALYRQSSFLLNSMGTQVFPSFVNLEQKPHMLGLFGSAWFDGQGVKTVNRHFVKDGYVSNYLLDAYSARQLKLPNTGNSGGVFNLWVESNAGGLSDVLAKMDTGFFVCSLMGQGINMVTGDYSRGASGFWVEKGQIQYPVEGVTIAGNLKDMFQNIVAIGNDRDFRHGILTGAVLISEMMIAGD